MGKGRWCTKGQEDKKKPREKRKGERRRKKGGGSGERRKEGRREEKKRREGGEEGRKEGERRREGGKEAKASITLFQWYQVRPSLTPACLLTSPLKTPITFGLRVISQCRSWKIWSASLPIALKYDGLE